MNEAELITLAESVTAKIRQRGLTLAVAESCTGGWLSKIITEVSGVSAIYKGGVCTYANEIKSAVLGVKEETLKTYGAVSEQTARQMSEGVCRAMNTDIGAGITGIAGPLSDNTEKPVGLIYVSVTVCGETCVKELRNTFTENVRTQNRYSAVKTALELLGDLL